MSSPSVSEVMQIGNRLFPLDTAESWDNCGIQIGDPAGTVDVVTFSLDPTPFSVDFAVKHSSRLLITHHPLLLEPVKNITTESPTGRTLLAAARSGVNIISFHTNLDAAPDGLNDYLAGKLGLQDVITPEPARCARMGNLAREMSISEFARFVSAALNINSLRIISDDDKIIRKIFCVSGSGMGYFKEALRHDADLMLTGDVRYHAALEALESGMPVIDAGHFGLEQPAAEIMMSAFELEFKRLDLSVKCVYCPQSDPFKNFTTGVTHL